ncbi:MAG: AAA family ATPase [Planctomycetaceae bacterium]|jgi:hypothetical protein|nr:AAA family ATPase [Planctomycetaceae bacterium]
MNLKSINATEQQELQMRLVNENIAEESNVNVSTLNTGIVKITQSDLTSYLLEQKGIFYRVEVYDTTKKPWLDNNFIRNCAVLAEILTKPKNGQFLIKVVFFNGKMINMGKVEIGVDEEILKTVKKKISAETPEELTDFVQERCQLTFTGKDGKEELYFVILAGHAAKNDFQYKEKQPPKKNIKEQQEQEPQTEKFENETEKSETQTEQISINEQQPFCVIGDALRIPTAIRKVADREILFALKFNLSDDRKGRDTAYCLVKGKLTCTDWTATGQMQQQVAAEMDKLLQAEGSYLNVWDKYGEIEGNLLLEQARKIGCLDFENTELTHKGRKYFFKQSLSQDKLDVFDGTGVSLEITDVIPPYIANPVMAWKDFEELLVEENKEKDEPKTLPNEISVNILSIDVNGKYIEIDNQIEPSENQFFVLSLMGEIKQVERRNKARQQILQGRAANPQLGLIIEENGDYTAQKRQTKYAALTAFVKGKIFKHPPTTRQREAIATALNTPDIALIQGPPGTGKTTVITAILERLNEEFDKTRSVRGSVLVSGFQHDAVENVIDRLTVNSLSPVKFGGRSDEDSRENRNAIKIENWCKDVKKRVRAKNPQLEMSEWQHKLHELSKQYILSPSRLLVRKIAQTIIDLPRELMSSQDIIDKAKNILDSLSQSEIRGNSEILQCIYGLRVTEEGFYDDGTKQAINVLVMLEEQLDDSDKKILETVNINSLQDVRQLKRRLLDRFTPRPVFRSEVMREDVMELLQSAEAELGKKRSANSEKDAILLDFLNQLEHNPQRVRESIENYNFVYVATVQQSAGWQISEAKTKNLQQVDTVFMGKDAVVIYDAVIIDEAARTSPRDLMIPMTQGKKIILVGDHRQLPHIIDTDIIEKLCNEETDNLDKDSDLLAPDKKTLLEKSMFEYLFHRLKALEAKDGIQRTVTLDAQYRMHPVLGRFVSKEFYEQYEEQFDSPLEEKYFTQNLSGTNGKPLMWLDVPAEKGKEAKQGTSRIRQAEISVIGEQLKRWIDSNEGKDLSFGVISFYKAQTDLMLKDFAKYGLTQSNTDGKFDIVKEYQMFGEGHKKYGEERLRIGTVDAFQGKEFDVVFLSMVRNQPPKFNEPTDETEIEKKKIQMFGHLLSKNRLCVAVSRQKRLLVVVGDAALVETSFAEKSVPEMFHFLELCKKEGVYQ